MRTKARNAFGSALLLGLCAGGGQLLAQTHLGQLPAEHVNVQFFSGGKKDDCPVGGGSSATLAMYRMHPDGSTQIFDVPKGRLLVVTDWAVTGFNGGSGLYGQSLRLRFAPLAAGASSPSTPVHSQSLHLTADLDSRLFTLTGQSLAGLLVGEGVDLCPTIEIDDGSQSGVPLTVASGNYRGYLIDRNPAGR